VQYDFIRYSIIFTRRVYALANKNSELEFEQRSMASLLSKFRIDYSDLTLIPDITKKPLETSTQFFNELIKDFVVTEKEGENGNSSRATLNEDDGESYYDTTKNIKKI